MDVTSRVILLGPQRLRPTLRQAIESLDLEGPVATVTAGWEEREAEDEELDRHLGGGTRNLALFPRAERVFERAPELLAAARRRHDRQAQLRELYGLRLAPALAVVRELMARASPTPEDSDPADLLEDEIEDAIAAVRALDAHHLERIRELDRDFDEATRPGEHPEVERQRKQLTELLDGCSCVCVAGGHVRVLLERLRLFGVLELVGERPLVAWSAGAMVLARTIVLFHDSPPQGPGNAEVLGPGLGVFDGVLPLPHARRRLRLDDPLRVGLFARRFGGELCLALDEGVRVDWDGERWSPREGAERLTRLGTLEAVAT